jgi:hypothetical protein
MELLLVLLRRGRKPVFLQGNRWGWQSLFAHSKGKASVGQKTTESDKPKGFLGFFRFIVRRRRDSKGRLATLRAIDYGYLYG